MRYIPNSAEEREAMLLEMGRKSVADLFCGIPDRLRLKRLLDLPRALSETETLNFFRDLSDRVLQDDVLARLLTFPNVLVTAHQGFLTHEALAKIAEVTLRNVATFELGGEPLENEVRADESVVPGLHST